MLPQEYLGVILRRWRVIVVVFTTGLAIASYVAWERAPVYRASAKLRVSSERARIRVAPDGSASSAFDPVNDATLSAEVSLLQSVGLVREVLEPQRHRSQSSEDAPEAGAPLSTQVMGWLTYPTDAIGRLYRNMHSIPALSPFDRLVANTAQRIEVGVIGKSNLISVAYTADDPAWAAEMVNRLVTHHVERHTRLNQQSEELRFFEEQRTRLDEKRATARAALDELSRRENVDSLADERTALHTVLADVNSEMARAEIALVEASARTRFLKTALEPSHGKTAAPLADAPTGLALVKNRVLDLELQRTRLLSQFTPGSLRVKDIDAQLDAARALLEVEEQNPNAAYAAPAAGGGSLELDLARTQADIAAVQARIDALNKKAAQYQAAQRHLDAISSEYAQLEQEAAQAESEYQSYVKAVDEAKISHVLDDLGIVNLTVVEHAEVPVAPQSSSQWNIVILGGILSLAAAVGLGFARDHLDPSIKSAAQAERLTGLPVLVEIAP